MFLTILMSFEEKVWKLCRKIPKGKVATYKEIGKALGTKAYRAIGNALRKNPFAPEVPCHRVIRNDGSLGGFEGKLNNKKKKELLEREGIEVRNGKIDLGKYGYGL